MIANELYDIHDDKYPEDPIKWDNIEKVDKCRRDMFCTYENCTYKHYLSFEDRKFIFQISDPEVTDEEAEKMFDKKYGIQNNEKSYTPASDALSVAKTVPTVSPIPTSQVGFRPISYKEMVNPTQDNLQSPEDNTVAKMGKIVSDIKINNMKAAELKQNIPKKQAELAKLKEELAKMETELAVSESIVTSGKQELKELTEQLNSEIMG